MLPALRGHFGMARSVRLSVPWRSCLGYRHAGCLQLSHRRPPEMCGRRTLPRTDVDPPRFLPPSNCHRRGGGHIVSPATGRYLVRGNVTAAGWQVTLCDPMWHVSSRSGVATLRTAIHLLLTHLLTYLFVPRFH